jgi:hypothetical protein
MGADVMVAVTARMQPTANLIEAINTVEAAM